MANKQTLPSTVGGAGKHLIVDGVMTGTTTLTSESFNIQNLDNIGLQIKWTGAAVGALTVECTIDNTNWIALTFDPVITQPNNNATSYLIDLNNVPFPYIRVKYVNASSTGVLNAWLSAKGIS